MEKYLSLLETSNDAYEELDKQCEKYEQELKQKFDSWQQPSEEEKPIDENETAKHSHDEEIETIFKYLK